MKIEGPVLVDNLTPLLRQFPALLDAVPPAHVEPVGEPIAALQRTNFWKFDDQIWRQRLLPSSAGLVGPITLTGDCISSLSFPFGVRAWFDPTLPAEHGDLVLTGASPAAVQKMVDDGKSSPRWWREMSGQILPNVWCKQLQRVGGHPYFVADDGALAPLGSRILGVLRHYRSLTEKVPLTELQAMLRP